ncbi:hypothetical protein H8S90_19725 [Olivibacter sp. SDN3]|uniref:hypothetical protein n=1 Tax=Olivibacter sp. SDN3 TaxID=2764720 RepID=UPI0016519F35|nr:hypothetical protein [Olivibacter sp. SDN3]QNL48960.1 hypothetical protein H8S90_19725 [Olivibacter sp. SDN3]
MARQSGIIKLKGTIGDITFYKSKDGFLARQKGGIEKERFLSDPKFQRTRENAAEFGRAGKASKAFCTAIRPVLNKTQDSRMISRLVKSMMQVIKADQISNRGQRNVLDGELILLQGFDFNGNARLSATVYTPYNASIARATGLLDINVPSFTPDSQIVAPGGTTHFRLISAGVEVDFENETFVLAQSSSGEMTFDNLATETVSLSNDLGVTDSTKPLFLVFGIEFLQQVNGSFYALNNGAYNALSLVLVDTGIDSGEDVDEGTGGETGE